MRPDQLLTLWAANNVGLWLAVGLCTLLDFSHLFKRLQPGSPPLSGEQWKACIKDAIQNEIFLLLIMLTPLLWLYQPREMSFEPMALLRIAALDLPIMIVLNDALYYWTHRLFHQPGFYARFHKRHHQFTAPMGVAAVYMTPMEFFVNQVFPATAGICLTGTPFLVAAIYYGFSGFGGTMNHSGFWFAEFHDDHHRLFNYNFGLSGSKLNWDYWCDTLIPEKFARKPDDQKVM